MHKTHVLIALICFAKGILLYANSNTANEFDVLIYGATPAGICAAVAAADQGAKTVLIEEKDIPIGGAFTNGADCVHASSYKSLSKSPREFFDRVYAYYCNIYGEDSGLIKSASAGALRGGKFEPSIAGKILNQMIGARENIKLIKDFELKSAKVENGILRSISGISDGKETSVTAKAFVDASDYLVLAKASGAEFLLAKESEEKAEIAAVKESVYNLASWLARKRGVSEYNLILSRIPKNKAAMPKISEEDFKGLQPAFGYDRRSFVYNSLPNGKLRLCVKFKMPSPEPDNPQSAEVLGLKARALAIDFLKKILDGTVKLPEERLRFLRNYAPAADEAAARKYKSFINANPPRIKAECDISLKDLLTQSGRIKSDSVAVAEMYAPKKPLSEKSGSSAPKSEAIRAEIPLAAMLPAGNAPKNLCICTGISASCNAYALLNNQCLFMNLGAVAGTYAVQTAKEIQASGMPDMPPDSGKLKKTLKRRGAKTDISEKMPEVKSPTPAL